MFDPMNRTWAAFALAAFCTLAVGCGDSSASVGVVAADDVLEILARELGQLAAVVRAMPPAGIAQGLENGGTGPGSKIYGKE